MLRLVLPRAPLRFSALSQARNPSLWTKCHGLLCRGTGRDALGFSLIVAWFLYFAHDGLRADLSGDDLMNLHGYLLKSPATLLLDLLRFWSTAYRPLGAVFYVPLYEVFGLNPIPYRVGCFLILVLNLFLLYRFTLRLSHSAEIAFLATFIASYHAWFVDLYYSAGTVYDLLCYALYLSGFLVYLRIRDRNATGGLPGLTCIALLYILALNAKEMAVTFPLFLLLYEVIFHGERMRCPHRWISVDLRAVWITGAITVVYVVGKLTGPESLVQNPAYALTISPGRFLDTFHLYLNPLFYQDHRFHDSNTIQLIAGMLLVALWRRSRTLFYAWFWLLLTILPVAFIGHYSAFFEYLPAAGWALYAATLLVMLRRFCEQVLHRSLRVVAMPSWVGPAGLVLLVAGLLAPLHSRESIRTLHVFMSVQPPTREITEDLSRQLPALPQGSRILFVKDPFPPESHFLLFATRLLYRDMSATVERTRLRTVLPADYSSFDAVLVFQAGHLALLRRCAIPA